MFAVVDLYVLATHNKSEKEFKPFEGTVVIFTVSLTSDEEDLNKAIAWEGIQLNLKYEDLERKMPVNVETGTGIFCYWSTIRSKRYPYI